MTVKERILAIRLIEKIDRNPEYAERIGVREEEDGKEIKVSHMAEESV